MAVIYMKSSTFIFVPCTNVTNFKDSLIRTGSFLKWSPRGGANLGRRQGPGIPPRSSSPQVSGAKDSGHVLLPFQSISRELDAAEAPWTWDAGVCQGKQPPLVHSESTLRIPSLSHHTVAGSAHIRRGSMQLLGWRPICFYILGCCVATYFVFNILQHVKKKS